MFLVILKILRQTKCFSFQLLVEGSKQEVDQSLFVINNANNSCKLTTLLLVAKNIEPPGILDEGGLFFQL